MYTYGGGRDGREKQIEMYKKTVLNFEENGYTQYPGETNSYEKKFSVDGVLFRVTVSCRFIIDIENRISTEMYRNDIYAFSASYAENCEKDICSDIENNIVYFWLHSFGDIFNYRVRYQSGHSGKGISILGLNIRDFGFVQIINLTEMSTKDAYDYISLVVRNRLSITI
jgi:hypothetical protein